MTSAPFHATVSRPLNPSAPPRAVNRNSKGTSARSSNSNIANAARPTALVVPAIGITSAVDDIASARPSTAAAAMPLPVATSPAPISTAPPSNSAAPTPNTCLRIAHSRLKLSSRPIANSNRIIPKSANGAMPAGSVIDTASSHGRSFDIAPSANGPATIPTRMKPITGLIFNRANAGITIPAAPRMVSASDKAGVISIAPDMRS